MRVTISYTRVTVI